MVLSSCLTTKYGEQMKKCLKVVAYIFIMLSIYILYFNVQLFYDYHNYPEFFRDNMQLIVVYKKLRYVSIIMVSVSILILQVIKGEKI